MCVLGGSVHSPLISQRQTTLVRVWHLSGSQGVFGGLQRGDDPVFRGPDEIDSVPAEAQTHEELLPLDGWTDASQLRTPKSMVGVQRTC